MKRIQYLFLLLLVLCLVPMVAFAEGEEDATLDAEQDNRVTIYFFHGDGCSHCAETNEWFESIEEEYGYKYNIIRYEVWYDEENADLMSRVAAARGEDAGGVPYLIIGDKSWIGFAKDTMASEILAQIDSMYETPVAERYDIMDHLKDSKETDKTESTGNDVLSLIIILLVAGGIGFGIYKARKTTN
ncbi:MAG: hypothetical protein J6X28_01150 [Bacilli bacterium]|nr:hypothetical protein [Bacilli bacterium]